MKTLLKFIFTPLFIPFVIAVFLWPVGIAILIYWLHVDTDVSQHDTFWRYVFIGIAWVQLSWFFVLGDFANYLDRYADS